MQRINHHQVGISLDQLPDRGEHAAHRRANTLPPVQGDQQNARSAGDRQGHRNAARDHPVQSIDHGVAGDEDAVRSDAFAQQVGSDQVVGAKFNMAAREATTRLNSSGNGSRILPVRNPAST